MSFTTLAGALEGLVRHGLGSRGRFASLRVAVPDKAESQVSLRLRVQDHIDEILAALSDYEVSGIHSGLGSDSSP